MQRTHEEAKLNAEAQDCLVELGDISKDTRGPWVGGPYDGALGYWPGAEQ